MLDGTDRSILRTLQQNARLSSQELGETLGLSRSAAQQRVQNLRETGAIAKEIAVVSTRHADPTMTFIVEVDLERERIDLLDEFRRSMLKLQEVQQCYYVTGHTDFILIVLAKIWQAMKCLRAGSLSKTRISGVFIRMWSWIRSRLACPYQSDPDF